MGPRAIFCLSYQNEYKLSPLCVWSFNHTATVITPHIIKVLTTNGKGNQTFSFNCYIIPFLKQRDLVWLLMLLYLQFQIDDCLLNHRIPTTSVVYDQVAHFPASGASGMEDVGTQPVLLSFLFGRNQSMVNH